MPGFPEVSFRGDLLPLSALNGRKNLNEGRHEHLNTDIPIRFIFFSQGSLRRKGLAANNTNPSHPRLRSGNQ